MKKTILIFFFTSFVFIAAAQNANFKWAKQMTGNGQANGSLAVTLDSSGNVYTTGYFAGTVDFDPGVGVFNLSSVGDWDIFISKSDVAGDFVWAKSMGGSGQDVSTSIVIDANGNVYTTGHFNGTVDFDPGPCVYNLTSVTSQDIFASKLDASGNFIWAKQLGGLAFDCINFIAIDANSNVYINGNFTGTADFDPGPGIYNLTTNVPPFQDIFVCKLDASGNFIWAKQIGVSDWNYVWNIAIDADGNIFTTGEFGGTADFDPGPGTYSLSSAGNYDGYILKLNADGNFLWAKRIGGVDIDGSTSIAVDTNGNIFTTGNFTGTVDFDPGPGTYNLNGTLTYWENLYLLKLDASGNFLWAKQMRGSEILGSSIAVDAPGNVYTTGTFKGIVDFDPGPGIYNLTFTGNIDMYVSKLNLDGNFVWAKQMGGNSETYGSSIALDTFENIYTTGEFNGTTDFDPGTGAYNLTSSGGYDIFVHKMSPCTNNTGSSLFVTDCKNYALNGRTYTSSGIYTQTVLNSIGCDSIITLNLTINRINADIYVSACNSYTWRCHTYNNCNIITTQCNTYNSSGVYTDTVITANACDSIITLHLTISNNNSTSTANAATCNSYTWNGQTFTSSGTYRDTLIAASGCDSIVTLNLIIYPFLTSTVNAAACNSYTWNGQTITSSGTYTDTLIAANGCDSIVTLNLTIGNTNSASVVNAVACNSYTWNGQTIIASGIYRDTLIAANGCDSIVTLNLIIYTTSTSDISTVACNSYNWNGQMISTSGVYKDTLITAHGCDSIVSLQLTIKPKSYAAINQSICQGQNYAGYIISGMYTDTLVAANGCDSIRTLQLTVLPKPVPDLGADKEICSGDSLMLSPGQFNNYLWQNGTTQSSITIKQQGLYSVVVTNNCGTAKDEVLVKEGFCDILFPSGFTPNNDGKNDLFKMLGGYNLKEYHLVVYNRWGQKVFETFDHSKGWNGSFNGQLQQSAIFAWFCEFKKPGDVNKIIMKGTIALIR